MSPYQYQLPMASHDTNTNNNANPAAHSLNIIPKKFGTLRPGTDQSRKAAFGKSAFAKTCFLLLKIRLVHINWAKILLSTFYQKALCSLHVPKCTRKYLCFLLDWCVPVISLTKQSTFEHVLAKVLLPKAAFLDWSVPGLRVPYFLGMMFRLCAAGFALLVLVSWLAIGRWYWYGDVGSKHKHQCALQLQTINVALNKDSRA